MGYVLKRDKKKMNEMKGPEISLVDLIETERNALGSSLVRSAFLTWCFSELYEFSFFFLLFRPHLQTKVTLESFLAWKKRKIQEKKDRLLKEEDQKKKDYKSGKQFGISGREMFSFNPELADDGPVEDGDAVFDSYTRDEDEDESAFEYKEIDWEELSRGAQEVDGTGTVADSDRLQNQAAAAAEAALSNASTPDENGDDEDASSSSDVVDATPFNENLFLDEDLDGLDDELNELDLDDKDE